MTRSGGVALTLATLYFVIELAVARAWTLPYDVTDDSISSLGVTTCTPNVCSPLHILMNAAFIGLGVLIVSAALLLRSDLEPGALQRWTIGLAVVTGISTAATAVVPLNLGSAYHSTVVIPGFLCRHIVLVLIALSLWNTHRAAALWSAFCAAIGVGGLLLILSPLGFGVTERIALYPLTIWMIVTGVGLLISSRTAAAPTPDPRT